MLPKLIPAIDWLRIKGADTVEMAIGGSLSTPCDTQATPRLHSILTQAHPRVLELSGSEKVANAL